MSSIAAWKNQNPMNEYMNMGKYVQPPPQMFNQGGSAFQTPATDAINAQYMGGMVGLPNAAIPDSPALLPQSPSLLESLKGWIPGGFLDSTDEKGIKTQGWGGPALGVVSGLGNAYMGMQQLNLAKETLANNKRQFDMNYGAQRTTTNARLEDRQRARVNGSAPGTYESVGDYMNKHRVV